MLSWVHVGLAGSFGALLVGWLVVEARELYLARRLFTLFILLSNHKIGNIFSGHFDRNHRDLDLNNLISMIVTLTHLTWIKTRSYWSGWVDGAPGLPVAVAGQGREARHGGSTGGHLPNLSLPHLRIISLPPSSMSHHQSSNRRILFNLLPAHVATHFLDNQFRSNMVNIHFNIYHWKGHSYAFSIAMVLQPRIITLE